MAGARLIEIFADLFERAIFKGARRDAERAVTKDAGTSIEKGWAKEGLSLDQRANADTDSFLEHARNAEPKITQDVTDLSKSVPGSELAGLEFRLKSGDSLKRKIATVLRASPKETVSGALSDIKDSVRYTIKIPYANYRDGVSRAVSGLKAKGYENVSWKNTWSSDGYKGINSAWRDPVTGQVFEVQFHTPDSFNAKMETHGLYEQSRLPGTPPDVSVKLDRQQDAIFGRVPVPPDAMNMGRP